MKSKIMTMLSLLAVQACHAPANVTDTNEMLTQLSSTVVEASYGAFESESGDLSVALSSFCETPSADSLAAAQDAWKVARAALKETEVFSFGPYMDDNFDATLDFWPTRTSDIEEAIDADDVFSAEDVADIGAGAKGLPSIEYLIFEPQDDTVGILASFDGSDGETRCSFLMALGEDLLANAQNLYLAWSPTGENYSNSLSTAGQGSVDYETIQDAINALVNAMGNTIELVKDTKLGKPMGKTNGGVALPGSVESPYSDNSLADMIHNLNGIKNFYNGDYSSVAGLGLYDLVHDQDPDIADSVNTYIDNAIEAVEAIPEPLSEAVIDHAEVCETAYVKLGLLKSLVSSSVTGLLGSTTYFNDNDGD